MITVIMTCYNQGKFIDQAIKSVISQEDVDFVLKIYDDKSTDDSVLKARRWKNIYPHLITIRVNDENVGLIKNYAQALEEVETKYVSFLEADDVFLDVLKLRKQKDYLNVHPEVGMVYTDALIFGDGKNTSITALKNSLTLSDLFLYNPIKTSATMFRSDCLSRVNLHKAVAKKYLTIDLLLWLSLASYSRIVKMRGVSSGYRIHEKSISHNLDYEKLVLFYKSVRCIRLDYLNDINVRNFLLKRRLKYAYDYEKYFYEIRLKKLFKIAYLLLRFDLFVKYRWLRG